MGPARNWFWFLFSSANGLCWLGELCPFTHVPSVELWGILLIRPVLSVVNQMYLWFSRTSSFNFS